MNTAISTILALSIIQIIKSRFGSRSVSEVDQYVSRYNVYSIDLDALGLILPHLFLKTTNKHASEGELSKEYTSHERYVKNILGNRISRGIVLKEIINKINQLKIVEHKIQPIEGDIYRLINANPGDACIRFTTGNHGPELSDVEITTIIFSLPFIISIVLFDIDEQKSILAINEFKDISEKYNELHGIIPKINEYSHLYQQNFYDDVGYSSAQPMKLSPIGREILNYSENSIQNNLTYTENFEMVHFQFGIIMPNINRYTGQDTRFHDISRFRQRRFFASGTHGDFAISIDKVVQFNFPMRAISRLRTT